MSKSQELPDIRVYKKGDELGYIALMNLVFPRYKCDIKRWRWEYADNPFGSIQVFADFAGNIIGHMGLIFIPIKIGDRIFLGSQAVDLAVHPSFRGRGIFLQIGKKLMQEAAEKGILISYGVPNEPAYRGHLKYGWFFVSKIPVLIKPITKKGLTMFILVNFLGFIKKPTLESIFYILTSFKNAIVESLKTKSETAQFCNDYKVNALASFDGKIDILWEKASQKYSLIVARNTKYLNWRYVEKPHSRYIILTITKDQEIEGYIVLSITHGLLNLKKGYIVDLLAISKRSAHCLLNLAFEFFAKEKVDSITCWAMERNILYNSLIERGFLNDYFSPAKLICRINTDDNVFEKYYRNFEKKWYFTIGDSDIV
ncbi:MAG: GNAT family N-acetyltransferase [Candidatus Aenigmatarchaeota archaeon]